jgi:hypothetical protein
MRSIHVISLFIYTWKDSLGYPLSNVESRRSKAKYVLELFELHWSLFYKKMMKNHFFTRKWSSFHSLLVFPLVKFSFHLTDSDAEFDKLSEYAIGFLVSYNHEELEAIY